MFRALQAKWKNPDRENTSQKIFMGADKISEILNDSDSDGVSFSEISDSNMCKVNSPPKQQQLQRVVQP